MLVGITGSTRLNVGLKAGTGNEEMRNEGMTNEKLETCACRTMGNILAEVDRQRQWTGFGSLVCETIQLINGWHL